MGSPTDKFSVPLPFLPAPSDNFTVSERREGREWLCCVFGLWAFDFPSFLFFNYWTFYPPHPQLRKDGVLEIK